MHFSTKTCKSKENREIQLFDNGVEGEKTILVIGVMHGDEPQGKFLIENHLKSKNISKAKNKMLYIPCLNPDGMANKTRYNSNKVDINRNFPTKNWKETEKNEFWGGTTPNSEIETQFTVETIERYKPDIILTLHAPYRIVNFDGDALKFSKEIADMIKYPIQADIGYPTPGSFGTWAGVERQIPTITLELDEEIDVKELIEPMEKIFTYLENL